MNLSLTVLQIVAPVFFLGGAGFVWVRAGFEYPVDFVTRLAMSFAVPCLVFTSLMTTEIAPEALSVVSVAALAAYAIVTGIVIAVGYLAGLPRRVYWAPLIFSNTGNVGLPLAFFAFQDTGLAYAVVIFAFTSIGAFTYGVWLVSGESSVRKMLREPILISALLGALCLWQGWQTPEWITNSLQLTGQMAIPLMLLTLGVAIARLAPGHLGRSVVLSLAKSVVCAAVAAGVGYWFGLPPVAHAVLILQFITPVAVTSYLLSERYQSDPSAVAGLVMVSTLLSVITIPLALAFLV